MFAPTYISDSDPTVNDDYSEGIRRGIFWWNSDTNAWFVCADESEGAADWKNISAGSMKSWGDYTPALSWTGGTPTISSSVYRYALSGNLCEITIEIVGTNNSGSSITSLAISLPADAAVYGTNYTPVDFVSNVNGSFSKSDTAWVDTSVSDPGAITHPIFPTIANTETFALYYKGFYETS